MKNRKEDPDHALISSDDTITKGISQEDLIQRGQAYI